MKLGLTFLFIITLSICSIPEGTRLIEFFNGTQMLVSQTMLSKLVGQPGKQLQFIDITDLPSLKTRQPLAYLAFPEKPTQQQIVKGLFPEIEKNSEKNMREIISHLSSYKTRYYTTDTGIEAAHWIHQKFKSIINELPEQRRKIMDVKFFNHTGFKQPSVIATIKGSSDAVVILGAHEDSVSWGGDAPGADDDGSGIASVMEAFRVIAQSDFVPQRTLEFHSYAAEEVGLRGSGQMAQDYKSRNVNVYAMMQQDCIGYNPKNLSTIAIIRESGTSATLTAFLRKLVPEYLNLSIKDTSAPGGSDHQSWTRAGYHTCIPSEAEWNSGAWHTSRDTIDRLNIKHMTYFVKLGVAFAVELSLAQ